MVISSGSKIPLTNPPIPNPILKDLEQLPFQSYLDSLKAAASDGIQLDYDVGVQIDQLVLHGEVPGQAEYAYAFRTSVAGAVTSLAVLEPAAGSHPQSATMICFRYAAALFTPWAFATQ